MPRLPRFARRHARTAFVGGAAGLLIALVTTALSGLLLWSVVTTNWAGSALPGVTEAGLVATDTSNMQPATLIATGADAAPTTSLGAAASPEPEAQAVPHASDRDDDGLDDHLETLIGTDEARRDSDHDGRRDGSDACPLRAGGRRNNGCTSHRRGAAALAGDSNEPPTVLFVTPSRRTSVRDAATIELTAGDDRALRRVDLYDGPRLVCSWNAPPLRCRWHPTGDAVGRRALVAVAYDQAGGIGLARRSLRVKRFTPVAVRARSRVLRQGSRARVLVVGRLQHAPSVPRSTACRGSVRVRVREGRRVRRVRTAKLASDCSFSVGAGVRRVRRRAVLRVDVRFLGNRTLLPASVRSLRAAPTPRAARLIAGRDLALAPAAR